MISHPRRLGRTSLALPAALIVCLLPAAARAEKVTITNGTSLVVVVQATAIVNKQLESDPPSKLAPGASTATTLPGDKVITIIDPAKPNNPLCRKVIAGGTDDQEFAIVIVGKGANAQVTLVPVPKKP
jgi:hypothetical protein